MNEQPHGRRRLMPQHDTQRTDITDDLEIALRNAVIDQALDCVVIIDRDSRIIEFNPAAERTFGYVREQVLGRPLGEILIPDRHRAGHAAGMAHYQQTGEGPVLGQRIEVEALHAQGHEIPVELAITAVEMDGAQYFTAYLRDISDRKDAERRLLNGERRYRDLFQLSSDAIIVVTPQGQVVDVNERAEEFLGRKRADLVGMSAFGLHPDRSRPGLVSAMAEVSEHGQARGEIDFLRPDGSVAPADVSAKLLGQGDEALIHVAVRDISERRQMDDERKRYRRMLEQAQELAKMGSWEWSPGTGEVIWSDATYNIFGADPAKGPWTLDIYNAHVHPDDLPELQAQVEQALASGEPYEVEHRIIRPDGRNIIIEGRGAAITDAEGRIERLLGTVRDVTVLRQAQQELTRAKEEAEAANAAKSHFLAAMSHEMRTPLNGVIGLLDLLDDSPLNPRQSQHVARARNSAETLLALLNDVLDLSKIEAGEMSLDPAPFSPRELLQQAVDIVTLTAKSKTLPIRLHVAENVPAQLSADSAYLRQVVTNLLSNAVKFTHEGEIVVHAAFDRAAGSLSVKVIDTGIGIPGDKLDRLFDRFTQADPGLSRRYGGAGLGLAICRDLVTLMGGEIGVESRPGTGSRFWFRVPVSTVAEGPIPISAAGAGAEDRSQLDARILLAEDSPTNALVTKTHLQDAGAVVDIAFNGVEAVEAVQRADYDLILMDVSMPEMDGLSAARIIREMADAKASVPIIALTAHALRGDREQCLEAGMDDYLVKPVKRPDLLHAVRERLALRAVPGEAARPARAEADRLLRPEDGAQDWREAPDLYRAVLEAFQDELRGRIRAVEQAAAGGDAETLRREAHTIKGAAHNVGAIPLSRAALAAEKAAEAGDEAGAMVEALLQAGAAALDAVAGHLIEDGAGQTAQGGAR